MAMENRDYLRLLVQDKIPVGGSEGDALFANHELDEILSRMIEMYPAAAEAWAIKAGSYAALIDMDESGSKRKLSQKFEHAKKMAHYYSSLGGGSYNPIIDGSPGSTRVVGKIATMREQEYIFKYKPTYSRREA